MQQEESTCLPKKNQSERRETRSKILKRSNAIVYGTNRDEDHQMHFNYPTFQAAKSIGETRSRSDSIKRNFSFTADKKNETPAALKN